MKAIIPRLQRNICMCVCDTMKVHKAQQNWEQCHETFNIPWKLGFSLWIAILGGNSSDYSQIFLRTCWMAGGVQSPMACMLVFAFVTLSLSARPSQSSPLWPLRSTISDLWGSGTQLQSGNASLIKGYLLHNMWEYSPVFKCIDFS